MEISDPIGVLFWLPYSTQKSHANVPLPVPNFLLHSRDLELEAGGFSGGRRGAESAESPSAESLYTACMQQQQQQEEEEAAALHHQAAAAAAAVAARSNQEQLAGGECGSLLAQQQQQLVDQHRELGRRLVIDEGEDIGKVLLINFFTYLNELHTGTR